MKIEEIEDSSDGETGTSAPTEGKGKERENGSSSKPRYMGERPDADTGIFSLNDDSISPILRGSHGGYHDISAIATSRSRRCGSNIRRALMSVTLVMMIANELLTDGYVFGEWVERTMLSSGFSDDLGDYKPLVQLISYAAMLMPAYKMVDLVVSIFYKEDKDEIHHHHSLLNHIAEIAVIFPVPALFAAANFLEASTDYYNIFQEDDRTSPPVWAWPFAAIAAVIGGAMVYIVHSHYAEQAAHDGHGGIKGVFRRMYELLAPWSEYNLAHLRDIPTKYAVAFSHLVMGYLPVMLFVNAIGGLGPVGTPLTIIAGGAATSATAAFFEVLAETQAIEDIRRDKVRVSYSDLIAGTAHSLGNGLIIAIFFSWIFTTLYQSFFEEELDATSALAITVNWIFNMFALYLVYENSLATGAMFAANNSSSALDIITLGAVKEFPSTRRVANVATCGCFFKSKTGERKPLLDKHDVENSSRGIEMYTSIAGSDDEGSSSSNDDDMAAGRRACVLY